MKSVRLQKAFWMIMELEETEDGEESLLQINDPMIAEEVYAIFKEKNSDIFDFED